MKIAFFDSGMGGLSVLHHAMKVLPQEQFVFYADEDNVPYGTKTKEQVQDYVDKAFRFLLKQDVKAIVVACNTATSVAVAKMRSLYDVPIIGMEPAAKKALDMDGTKRVLVTATPITVKGRKMELLIEKVDKDHLVDRLALPELVTFAERQEFNSPAVTAYLQEQFAPFDFSVYSALVLGCTHFNYFKDTMRQLLPENVQLVDGNEGTVRQLIRRLQERNQLEEQTPSVEYFYSGRRVTDEMELKRLENYLSRLEQMYRI
ncbi:MAG: glutamate racemase [Selenomonas sp.]|nr:glutamate racemase [Selenomonas sp.]